MIIMTNYFAIFYDFSYLHLFFKNISTQKLIFTSFSFMETGSVS